MVAEPAATPVTTPVLFTVAIEVFDEAHGLVTAAVPDPVSAVADPTHTLNTPVIVGNALTVILVEAAAVQEPTEAIRLYIPLIPVVAKPKDGFCAFDVNAFGPVHV